MNFTATVVLMTLLSSSYAAVFLAAGCPFGRRQGETWYTFDCMECSCRGTTHTCYSCGVSSLDINKSLCYIERDDKTKYPKCCEEKVVCMGDPGFNAVKLTNTGDIRTTPKGPRVLQTLRLPFPPKNWPALM